MFNMVSSYNVYKCTLVVCMLSLRASCISLYAIHTSYIYI